MSRTAAIRLLASLSGVLHAFAGMSSGMEQLPEDTVRIRMVPAENSQ